MIRFSVSSPSAYIDRSGSSQRCCHRILPRRRIRYQPNRALRTDVQKLVQDTNHSIISVDYRLEPESKSPVPVDEAISIPRKTPLLDGA
ncbi:hypothetical protein AMS62_11870 [Bacillus sp. FJAT-18019]|nr:hypothetical protein AMS62_11870 [Bacillus sp. FJAT-18019]